MSCIFFKIGIVLFRWYLFEIAKQTAGIVAENEEGAAWFAAQGTVVDEDRVIVLSLQLPDMTTFVVST